MQGSSRVANIALSNSLVCACDISMLQLAMLFSFLFFSFFRANSREVRDVLIVGNFWRVKGNEESKRRKAGKAGKQRGRVES